MHSRPLDDIPGCLQSTGRSLPGDRLRFWDIDGKCPHYFKKISRNDSISFDSAKQLTREMVEESVLSRSVSDVEVGSFYPEGRFIHHFTVFGKTTV